MNGGGASPGAGKWPLGLFGMLVLVAAGERFVASHDVDFSNASASNWKYAGRDARRTTKPGTVLCLGTSLVKYGVVSRLIEQETGRPAYNLAVCDGHMPSSYFLLRRALDAGAKPAALVVDCQDGPVSRGDTAGRAEAVRVNLRNWPELLTLDEWFDLAWTARDPAFLLEMAVSRVVPSFKARFEIRKSIVAACQGVPATSRLDVTALKRNWALNRGTMLMPRRWAPAVEDAPPEEAAEVLAALPRELYRRNHVTEAYARRFLTLAASKDIPVFWVLPPSSPEQQAGRDRIGMTAYFTKQAADFRNEFPNLTVVDGRRSGYRLEVFWDKVHLDRLGATVFSADLGAAIAARLGKVPADGRWVMLPRFRDRPFSVPLEDVAASRLATAQSETQR